MDNETANLHNNYGRREFAGTGLAAGIAREKLIFIIICSVAIVVAVIALVSFFAGGSKFEFSDWQCLEHNHAFSTKSTEQPPIECPKCGGEAVRMRYRRCPLCKEKFVTSRMRLTEQGQAQREARRKQAEATGTPARPMVMPPMETQYWLKQSDGNYSWSAWVPMGSGQSQALARSWKCPDCGK